MNKIILVTRHELVTTLGRRSFLFFAIGLPVLLVLVFGAIELFKDEDSEDDGGMGSGAIELQAEGYVDPGGLITSLPEGASSEYLTRYGDEEQAVAALEAGEIDAYYLIPADFAASNEVIHVYANDVALTSSGQEWMMRWTLLVNLMGGDEEQASLVWHPYELEATNLSPEPEHDRYTSEDCSRPGVACISNPLVRFIPAIMVGAFYFFFMISSQLLFNSVTAEKENRTIEVMMLSSSPRQLLAGKLAGLGLAGLLQAAIWVLSIYLVFTIGGRTLNLPDDFAFPPGALVWSIVFFVLGYVIYAGLMAGAGALVPSRKEGSQATFLVLMPLIAAYMVGILSPMSDTSQATLPVILSYFPLTAPVMMLMRLMDGAVQGWELALSTALMMAAAYLIVRASAVMFRAQHLLSGQSFSVKRYFGALVGRD
jgi:ABC-2 type transport system permease protein